MTCAVHISSLCSLLSFVFVPQRVFALIFRRRNPSCPAARIRRRAVVAFLAHKLRGWGTPLWRGDDGPSPPPPDADSNLVIKLEQFVFADQWQQNVFVKCIFIPKKKRSKFRFWLVWRSGNGLRHISEIKLYVEPG